MKQLVFAIVAVMATPPLWADSSEIRRCRLEKDGAARLACYDAIKVDAPPSLGGKAPDGATARPEEAPTPAADPNASFGMEGRTATARQETLESMIPGPFDGWVPRSKLRLANGQVWEISDGSQAAYDLKNPRVRIKRGVAGSFFIEIEGVSQTPRVRRVQ